MKRLVICRREIFKALKDQTHSQEHSNDNKEMQTENKNPRIFIFLPARTTQYYSHIRTTFLYVQSNKKTGHVHLMSKEKSNERPSVIWQGMLHYPLTHVKAVHLYNQQVLHSYPFLRNFSLKIRWNLFFFVFSGLQSYLNALFFL